MERYAASCRCIGRPNRFEPDRCFTCGRFLPDAIGERERGCERAGYMALLRAIERGHGRRKPPRSRRVEIKPAAEPTAAVQRVRGLLTVC